MLRLTVWFCLIASTVSAAGKEPRHHWAAAASILTRIRTYVAATITFNTPPTVSFSAPDPDTSPVLTQSTTISTRSFNGSNGNPWTLTISAAGNSLSGCPNVPASAVMVKCTSASNTQNSKGSAACTATSPVALSTTPIQLAGGNQGNSGGYITVNADFTFTDAWKYPASSSCTLNITYQINAQ